jgi:hypothetical protein
MKAMQALNESNFGGHTIRIEPYRKKERDMNDHHHLPETQKFNSWIDFEA